jgi:hypothetical protein
MVPAVAAPDAAAPGVAVAALDRVERKCRSNSNSRPNAISSSTHGMIATATFIGWAGSVVPVA